MRLSQIKIIGFKSFADRLDVRFSSGITAIVGPNGCGKSNIVDAIRWVLGEQRAAVLRGGRMEDVIFNGTARRKPLGMAEVSMTIENDRQLLPIEYSEVTITRRLFRSGESEYLLNKVPCRLKDITDLLLDTGMGSHAYSMIEQGHVDLIVNGSPLERRHLIEEAAGINKYKTRRRLAERKLESTEHDLVRIADILEEVEKQGAALRRQVWKCERYKRLTRQREELDIALAYHEYMRARAENEPTRAQIESHTRDKDALATRIATAEARIEKRRLELTGQEQRLKERQQEVNACDQQINALNVQVLVNRDRRTNLEQRIRSAKEEIKAVRADLERVSIQRKKAEQESRGLAETVEQARSTYRQREKEAQAFAGTLAARREQARVIQRRRLELVQRRTEKRGEGAALEARMVELRERRCRLVETEEALSRRLDDLGKEAKTANRHLKAATKAVVENQALKAAIEEDLSTKRRQHEEALLQKNALDAQRAVKEREHGLLIRMRRQYEGYGQGVRALLADGPSLEGLHGTIAENVAVEQYAAAIEACLGEALQYIVASTTEVARSGIGYLHEHNRGPASFLLLDRLEANGAPECPALPVDPDIIGPALDFVRADRRLEPAVRHLLSHVLLVRDMESALRLADRFNDGTGWRLLTPDGERVDPAGVIAGGAVPDGDTRLLSRTARIETLEREIERLTAEQEQRTKGLATLAAELDTLLERRKMTDRVLSEQQQAKQQAEQAENQFVFQQTQLNEQQRRLAEDGARIETMTREAQHRIADLAEALAQLDRECRDVDEADREANEDLAQLEAEAQRLTHAAQEARVTMISLESRGNELRTARTHLEQHAQRLAKTQEQRRQENADATERITALQQRLEQGEAELKLLYEERRQKEIARDAVGATHKTIQENIFALQSDTQNTRRALDRIQEQIHAAELQEAKCFERSHEIRRRLMHRHNIDPENMTGPPAVSDMEVFDPEAAEGLIQELQRKIDDLGPINLAAVDEYQAIKERIDFLTQQRDDLVEAKTNLEKTIIKMNRTARARFLDTFEEVRRNFMRTFQALFEGGEADLKLEEGDPLEVGIDIMARPRGKRLQSIALLSGGETALTAIALLFAIYLVKPSPFCVFDEVDAPLDDANVRRFATALQHFAQNTQFMVVTHNKRTMEAASYLYGVTMEEPGLSKIVSVRLEGEPADALTATTGPNGTDARHIEEPVGE